jgi:hypothetical protein
MLVTAGKVMRGKSRINILLITLIAFLVLCSGLIGCRKEGFVPTTSKAALTTTTIISTTNTAITISVISNSSQASITASEESDEPDTNTYQQYFSEMGLGRYLPDSGTVQNTATFETGDIVCLWGSVSKEVKITCCYTCVTRVGNYIFYVQTPGVLEPGKFIIQMQLTQPTGGYEYKVYVEDILVAKFPFTYHNFAFG